MPPSPDRFDRQVRFAPLGNAGQVRLSEARVLLVGCGALGGVLAQTLVRAGVGELAIVDRDVVCPTNLPRQVLFDEEDARLGRTKVAAAEKSLARIGGPTRVETHCEHVDARNLPDLARGCDLVLDGTDNLRTRYLLNDLALEWQIPWIYAGVVGARGLVLAVLPERGPCLRCLFPEPPAPGSLATCDTAGVLLPAVGAVASLAAGAAMRILARGPGDAAAPALLEVDVWDGRLRRLAAERDPDCPACARGERAFLTEREPRPVVLCGRNTVQVHGTGARPDFGALERSLTPSARELRRAGDFLRFEVEDLRLTLFPDGRALIEGTDRPERAQAAYDRWVGR